MTRITTVISQIAYDALLGGRRPPVITTDFKSAYLLVSAIEDDLGAHRGELMNEQPHRCVGMFDGVRIVSATYGEPDDTDWRVHFGALADIWSEA